NQHFLEKNSPLSSTVIVFHIGAFLLGIITFFYVLYANSFLVSLRQHEFGLYQILGAKRKKVAVVILIETLLLGIVALVLGLGLGSLLSNVVGKLLMQELPFAPQSYQALYFPALKVTAIFYIILFVLAALKNSFQLYNQSLLTLLNA